MFFEQSFARYIADSLYRELRSGGLDKIGIQEVKAAVSGFRCGHNEDISDKEADDLVTLVLRRIVEK